jgi:DNA-binding NarL/FixJ family response regulator
LSKTIVEFWRFSSRNREGHATHPLIAARNNLVLEMWACGETQDRIAEELDIDIRTISRLLARARRKKDVRAIMRHPATLKALEMAS